MVHYCNQIHLRERCLHIVRQEFNIPHSYWRAKRAYIVVQYAWFFCMYYIVLYIFPGQCHTVISNFLTHIILYPSVHHTYKPRSKPTMHCILLKVRLPVSLARPSRGKRGSGDTAIVDFCSTLHCSWVL